MPKFYKKHIAAGVLSPNSWYFGVMSIDFWHWPLLQATFVFLCCHLTVLFYGGLEENRGKK